MPDIADERYQRKCETISGWISNLRCLSVEVPTSTMGEKGCWVNFECLAESMLHDFSPINI